MRTIITILIIVLIIFIGLIYYIYRDITGKIEDIKSWLKDMGKKFPIGNIGDKIKSWVKL